MKQYFGIRLKAVRLELGEYRIGVLAAAALKICVLDPDDPIQTELACLQIADQCGEERACVKSAGG